MSEFTPERIDTVVIGGGQAGLSVGHHLAKRGVPFVIVDAGRRVGDSWRARWDSLRLFTPAKFDGLDGMPFPAPSGDYFPTKDEMADYLEAYASRFDLPVRLGFEVDRLSRNGDRFFVASGDTVISAEQVVVSMSSFQRGQVPTFAGRLDPGIVSMHSAEYRGPAQLRHGDVLVVGAANSGAEIALEAAGDRHVWLSGRHPGHIPFDIAGFLGRRILVRLVLRGLFHRVLTVDTPIGRKRRTEILSRGTPLVRTKPRDLDAAGIERVPRVVGVHDGRPRLADDRILDVANVIWCTGYDPGFSWIDIDVLEDGAPRHRRGVVDGIPGLYLVGLNFLYSLSSAQIHGVGRDAARVAELIATRPRSPIVTGALSS